ncbi:MAG: L,D-transpeptidase [Deltaproteobacteria bacterium]|nr:L,D-transpeptidase [Deltaproteobacteria bacterium]MBW1914238.1 L,D-transpeptidase [Deltaproteobacteria bacterium]
MRPRSLFLKKKKILFLWIFQLPLLFLPIFCDSAKGVRPPIVRQELVPNSLLRWPGSASDYAILVNKADQEVLLYRLDNLTSPEKAYPCSTGESEGPKFLQDDRKTPEGIYFFTDAFEDKYLAPIYGAWAFPLNYPNFIDKKEGRNGYGIWFHGTNKELTPRDSNGCIAMNNKDIDELSNLISLFDTPVIISSEFGMVMPDRLEQQARALEDLIEGWRSSWEDKEIENYISYYHSRFTNGIGDLKAYKSYKASLAKRYNRISVGLCNLKLLSSKDMALAKFDQNYRTSVFESKGVKTLYFQEEDSQWKIIGELFEEGEIKRSPTEKEVEAARLKEVESFINIWKDAWADKVLNKYIACYDETFQSKGMDIDAWKEYKRMLNRKYATIDIQINDLKIVLESEKLVKINFKQNYKADSYRDYGLKKMVLVKTSSGWKIKEEEWIQTAR